MPKLFENKQIFHIVSEVVILLALSYNVSSKFKTLKTYLDDICHRLDEQDEVIEKQNKQIESLTLQLKSLRQLPSQPPPTYKTTPKTIKNVKPPSSNPVVFSTPPSSPPPPTPPPNHPTEMVEESTHYTPSSSNIFSTVTFIPMMHTSPRSPSSQPTVEEIDSDDDLDDELKEELEELTNPKQDLKETVENKEL